MCGIVGIFERAGKKPDPARLRRMRDSIRYRGPDQAGEYIQGPIALGSRRLSIIDLAGGNQPITTPDGRYTIVLNGEIYNYKALRKSLEQHYPFHTSSDTEVLLYHYIKHGPEGLSQLNGMFALAIWDAQQNELFLARDRFGKKPLYYYMSSEVTIFGSELKTILTYLPTTPELNRGALTRYLVYEYIPDQDTPFKDIAKVPPGSWMKISTQTSETSVWWKLFPRPADYQGSFATVDRTFDALLQQAVAARMVADVPVGVLLSGGIDSTTIAWYMRQQTSDLHSFSVGFEDTSFNEASYANLAAESLHTHHHSVTFTLDTFTETLATIQDLLDEPIADASLLPTYTVSAEAKKFVTVVLDGDGADELLYGYDTFPAYQLSRWYEVVPSVIQQGISSLIQALPTRHSYFSLDFKLKSFLRGMPFPDEIRNQVWIGSFSDRELTTLLTPDYQPYVADVYQPITDLQQNLSGLQSLDRLSLVYLSHYLQGDILPKIDRATMYASLEARTPFLDPTFVSFVLQLPPHEKYSGLEGKQILRRVMAQRIPQKILNRKKQGFGIPLGAWLRGPLRELLQTTLSVKNIQAVGIVQPKAVEQLITQHLSGKADHRKQLWTLLVLHWWWKRWINQDR